MNTYPYSIDNGAGERLTFSGRLQEPDGVRVVGEALVEPGAGPPMHVHYLQEEAFTVLQGRIGYQVAGQAPTFAERGATVVFPAGVAHRFWNAGEDQLRCAAYIKPAGNVEFFLTALFASQKDNGGHRPALLDVAYLTQRYRSEYAMVEIPTVVRRVVLPLLYLVGRGLGRYRKYRNAPEPLTR